MSYTFLDKFGSAGTGNGLFDYNTGIATNANFIYVADSDNNRVQVFNRITYAYVGQFGSYGSGSGQFNYPESIVVNDNFIYVSDSNERVQKFDINTYAYVSEFGSHGTGDVQFGYITGMAINGSYIYVADSSPNHRVQIIDIDTHAYVGQFGSSGSGDGQFDIIKSLDVDINHIYVADMNTYRVQIFDINTYSYIGQFGSYCDLTALENGKFYFPDNMMVGEIYIYVADQSGRIQKFNKSTYEYVDQFGSLGYAFVDGTFGDNVWLSKQGNTIYATDGNSNRVQIFRDNSEADVDPDAGPDPDETEVEVPYIPGDYLENYFFVDSGLTYNGDYLTIVKGLDHIEGEVVSILADGVVLPQQVVEAGQVVLETPAKRIHVGLPYKSILQTMEPEIPDAEGTAKGRMKRINRCVFRLYNTNRFLYGSTPESEMKEVTFGEVEQKILFNGDEEKSFPTGWGREGFVTIVQEHPVPITVVAIIPEMGVS